MTGIVIGNAPRLVYRVHIGNGEARGNERVRSVDTRVQDANTRRVGARQHEPANRIIDISGDGPNNGPISTPIARDQVVARGFRINGLPIVTDVEPDLAQWYEANVVGGPGGFIEVAHGFEDFARAMQRKFQLEVAELDGAPAR